MYYNGNAPSRLNPRIPLKRASLHGDEAEEHLEYDAGNLFLCITSESVLLSSLVLFFAITLVSKMFAARPHSSVIILQTLFPFLGSWLFSSPLFFITIIASTTVIVNRFSYSLSVLQLLSLEMIPPFLSP